MQRITDDNQLLRVTEVLLWATFTLVGLLPVIAALLTRRAAGDRSVV